MIALSAGQSMDQAGFQTNRRSSKIILAQRKTTKVFEVFLDNLVGQKPLPFQQGRKQQQAVLDVAAGEIADFLEDSV